MAFEAQERRGTVGRVVDERPGGQSAGGRAGDRSPVVQTTTSTRPAVRSLAGSATRVAWSMMCWAGP